MNRPRRTQPGKLPRPGAAKSKPADAPPPVTITLRNLEIPLPEVIETTPVGFEGLIVSDPQPPQQQPQAAPADPAGPEAERAAQRAARRAQVRRDRMRNASDAGDTTGFATTLSEPVLRELPPVAAVVAAPATPAAQEAGDAAPTAAPAAAPSRPTAALAAATPPAAIAASTPAAAPAVLVVCPVDAGASPLCTQLTAFGFAVHAMSQLPELPAPWPFAAVFVDLAWSDADGSDGIDLCNQARELGRLPGERKPLLVLVAAQLSSTNRVRAGLAGCNEIIIGAITRGSVASVLDARGIALPIDPRNR